MVLFVLRNNIDSDTFIKDAFIEYLRMMSSENSVKCEHISKICGEGADMDKNIASKLSVIRGGKPYLMYDNNKVICFSLSHTDGCMLVAFSDSEIGVDIEKIKDRDYMPIAKREYLPMEMPDSLVDFYNTWTKKEAIIKCLGKNIAYMKDINTLEYCDAKNMDILEGYSVAVYPYNDDIKVIFCD